MSSDRRTFKTPNQTLCLQHGGVYDTAATDERLKYSPIQQPAPGSWHPQDKQSSPDPGTPTWQPSPGSWDPHIAAQSRVPGPPIQQPSPRSWDPPI